MTTIESGAQSTGRLWTARILSGIAVLFLLFDVVIHFMRPAPVVSGFAQLGYPISLAVPLAIIEGICLLLYVIPRTSVLGAVLLTGYLGGAVASNLRIGAPLLSNVLFPIYVALFLWGGLYLRDAALRAVFPVRK